MAKQNKTRKSCIDVFNAFLLEFANYGGVFEFPTIQPIFEIPDRLLPFSKCISSKSYDYWIHFYEDDHLFIRIWNNPKRYLPILRKYKGVILPDFSLYRDMPFVMQLWNIYRSRAIGHWLQINGIKVIPNVRFGDKRTYRSCCDGLFRNGVIAIGTHGTLKNKEDRMILIEGLDVVVRQLSPYAIIVYGSAPDSIFLAYKQRGIKIIHFESDYSQKRKYREEMI